MTSLPLTTQDGWNWKTAEKDSKKSGQGWPHWLGLQIAQEPSSLKARNGVHLRQTADDDFYSARSRFEGDIRYIWSLSSQPFKPSSKKTLRVAVAGAMVETSKGVIKSLLHELKVYIVICRSEDMHFIIVPDYAEQQLYPSVAVYGF